MAKSRYKRPGIVLLLLGLGLAACGLQASSETKLTPVIVQLSFTHQAEFAGFYAAEHQGYYAEEGLQVSFLEGGPEVDFITPVVNGAAQFGVAQPADLILARAAGMPVRTIAVIYRRSPIVFFSLSNSGITEPQDFIGKKIRSTTTLDRTLRAMMSWLEIEPDRYEVVYLPSDVASFASGDVPVWGGLLNIFVLEVQRAGHEINLIYPDDYGIHFYGNILITTDGLIQQNPDLVHRFTRATLRGWTHVVENPGTTGDFVQRYNPNANPELENERMIASIPLVNTGEDYIGWMKPEVWAHMEQTLREQGLLNSPLNLNDLYTMQFLRENNEQ